MKRTRKKTAEEPEILRAVLDGFFRFIFIRQYVWLDKECAHVSNMIVAAITNWFYHFCLIRCSFPF